MACILQSISSVLVNEKTIYIEVQRVSEVDNMKSIIRSSHSNIISLTFSILILSSLVSNSYADDIGSKIKNSDIAENRINDNKQKKQYTVIKNDTDESSNSTALTGYLGMCTLGNAKNYLLSFTGVSGISKVVGDLFGRDGVIYKLPEYKLKSVGIGGSVYAKIPTSGIKASVSTMYEYNRDTGKLNSSASARFVSDELSGSLKTDGKVMRASGSVKTPGSNGMKLTEGASFKIAADKDGSRDLKSSKDLSTLSKYNVGDAGYAMIDSSNGSTYRLGVPGVLVAARDKKHNDEITKTELSFKSPVAKGSIVHNKINGEVTLSGGGLLPMSAPSEVSNNLDLKVTFRPLTVKEKTEYKKYQKEMKKRQDDVDELDREFGDNIYNFFFSRGHEQYDS